MNFKTFLIETFFQLRSLERKLLYLTMINKIDILNITKNRTPYCIATKKKNKKTRKQQPQKLFVMDPKLSFIL